jgi:hypothetical protein
VSKASEIRAHAIDEAIELIRESFCLLERRCMDRDSGEACEDEPDPKLWCQACSLAGEWLP